MNRKINNALWCCEKIQEKIDEYKNKLNTLDKFGYSLDTKIAIRNEIESIVHDLENILYE